MIEFCGTVKDVRQFGGNVAEAASFSNTAVQLVAPASNVNGMVIRTRVIGFGNPTGISTMFVGTTAPTGYNDVASDRRIILGVSAGGGFSYMDESLEIPSGYGVWVIASGLGGVGAQITYDLKP